MTPERQNSHKPWEENFRYFAQGTIIINDIVGISLTKKHDQTHVSVVDGRMLTRITKHLNSLVLPPIIINDLVINIRESKNGIADIKVSSDKKFETFYSNDQRDLIEYFEKQRKNELARLSRNITEIETKLPL